MPVDREPLLAVGRIPELDIAGAIKERLAADAGQRAIERREGHRRHPIRELRQRRRLIGSARRTTKQDHRGKAERNSYVLHRMLLTSASQATNCCDTLNPLQRRRYLELVSKPRRTRR